MARFIPTSHMAMANSTAVARLQLFESDSILDKYAFFRELKWYPLGYYSKHGGNELSCENVKKTIQFLI
jgi:hypothetical protein